MDCAAAGEQTATQMLDASAAVRHVDRPGLSVLSALFLAIRPAASGPPSVRTNQLELTCSAGGGKGEGKLGRDKERKC